MSFEEPEWKILFRDAWGEPKSIGLIFSSYDIAFDFAIRNKIKNFIIVPLEHYYSYLDLQDQCLQNENFFWSSRIKRPYHKEITEVIDEEQYSETVTPRTYFPPTRFTNPSLNSRHTIFKPPIFPMKFQKRAIEEDDDSGDVTYYERTQNG